MTVLSKQAMTRDCVLKWQRLRLIKLKNPLLQLNQEAVQCY